MTDGAGMAPQARRSGAKCLLPLQEHQYAPQICRAIAPAFLMFRPDLLEVSAVQNTVATRENQIIREVLELVAKPSGQRNPKTPFRAVQNVVIQNTHNRLFQYVLSLRAAELEAVRNGGGCFHEPVVKERGPDLKRHGHAGTVYFRQNVVSEIGFDVNVLNAGQEIICVSPIVVMSKHFDGIVSIQRGHKFRRQQLFLLSRAEIGDRIEISFQRRSREALESS